MTSETFALSRLPVGCRAIITCIRAEGLEKDRFIDLGFSPSLEVKTLFHSPSGNPTAYEVMTPQKLLYKNRAGFFSPAPFVL